MTGPGKDPAALQRAAPERVQRLEAEIRRLRRLYYEGKPEVTDLEFDALEDALRRLAPESPVLAEVGSPPAGEDRETLDPPAVASRAVDRPTIGLPTKVHKIPMGSLEKISDDRLDAWAEKAGPLFLVQEKLDGISLEIEYESGELVDAITRGDGIVGEVVTHNAVFFKNVVRRLPLSFTGSVRGEVILRKSVFERHFVGEDFANPRNTVSGTVRRKHGDLSLNRHLEVFFYDVIAEGRRFATEREKMRFLGGDLGLALAVTYHDQTVEGIRRIYADYVGRGLPGTETPGAEGGDGGAGKRFRLDYEIDGLVLRADSIVRQEDLGALRNRPRFAMAYKFPSAGKETVLRGVDWSLGIGGRVTPIARLEPVSVGGVTVSNATLHNADYVGALGIRIGDVVLVERKGDVIPQVVRLVESRGGAAPAAPAACPSCGGPLEARGKHLRCPNRECLGKSYGDLLRWIQEMEIESLGEKWVEILLANGLVADPSDLYALTVDALTPLERMGETLASKVVRNIQESRNPALDRFVAALNVPEFSRQRAEMLMRAGYDTIEKLQAATVDELAGVKGFGEILARKVVEGLAEREERIHRLLAIGIEIRPPEETTGPAKDGPLAGKTFCFTGAVRSLDDATGKPFTRRRLEELVSEKGGRALSDVTSRLDYLVMADPRSSSSKAEKARELGTTVLGEDAFFRLLRTTDGGGA